MFAQECANFRLQTMALSGVDTDSSVGLIDFLLLLLLLLSGDIELNPGPTINDRPKNIHLLIQWIEPVNDWQTFGKSLPGISEEDISMIKRTTEVKYRKIVLIVTWLLNPKATWGGVIKAFTEIKEKTRAEYIEYCLEKSIQQFKSKILCVTV